MSIPILYKHPVNFALNIAMKKYSIYILILIFFWTISTICAQNVESPFLIEFKGTQISTTEVFTVLVKIDGTEQAPSVVFPNIKNFEKRELTKLSSTKKIGNKTVIVYTFSQNYYPLQKGSFHTGVIEIFVNKQPLRSEGTTVTVISFEDTEADIDLNEELEKEALQGVFLTVNTNKRQVYVEEGFNLKLSLMVADGNTIDLEFYEVEKQLEKVFKALKPANCWEENFAIREIPAIPITIGGKAFMEYRIYQASFFPINNLPINIPAIEWTMINKNETSKNKLQVFRSRPLTISVINLPPHPLKNQVMVGSFRIEEKISNSQLKTGSNYRYDFKVIGEGNIQSIREPIFMNSTLFDVYPPDVSQRIDREGSTVMGEKTFSYQLIPKQSGKFRLGDSVFWVYFDPRKARYDTLRSVLSIDVSGENVQQMAISSEPQSVYLGVEQWDSTKQKIDYQHIIQNIANVLIVLMLIGMILIMRKK